MKRLIFCLISLLFSCKQVTEEGLNAENLAQTQYDISLDKDKTLNERLAAITTAISLSEKSDSLFTQKLYQKQFLHFSLKQYDSLIAYSNEIEKVANSNKDYSYVGKQHHLIGYYYDEVLTNFDSAFYHYNLSKSYFLKINDSTNVGRRLISMGHIQKNQNDFFGSKETLTEALLFLDVQHDSKYIASCYNALATNHRKLLNYPDAISYYLKAIASTDSKKDVLIYQNNLAATYIDATHYEDAIRLLEPIVEDSLWTQKQRVHARVLDNLAYAQWLHGHTDMEKRLLKPLQLRKQYKDLRGQLASYTHLGEYYSKTNPTRAKSYFDSVIQLSKRIHIPRAEKDALKFWMKLAPKSVSVRDRYTFLQDSLYERETKVKTQFAKYKYDDSRKQEMILRLEKENAENELETNRQRSQKLRYLFGTVFLVSLLGFLSYSFRQRTTSLKQKSKADKLRAIFETEAELARRLHDDHGGKLNQTILLVEADADKSKILDNLEALYNQSRDFSREINAVDTGSDFWANILAMIQLRTPSNVKLFLRGGKEVDWKLQSATIKTVLFKIVQELMINLAKHSDANTVALTFQETSRGLKMNYEDDGMGASEEEFRLKNGLLNTEKRIEAIGGSIIFDSEKGNGFKAEIQFPT